MPAMSVKTALLKILKLQDVNNLALLAAAEAAVQRAC
jgi:hypothetical protein